MDLPSSAYQSVEHDFGSWSGDLFPPLQTIPTADQQSVGDTLSFAQGIDFSAYHDFPGISNFADLEPTWEGDTVPSVRDVKEDEPTQQEMCQLREENRGLKVQMDDLKRQVKELEDQSDGFQQWTARVACVVNTIRMKQEGLSPLSNPSSQASGPLTKRKRVKGRASKVEVVKDERKGFTN